MIETKWNYDLNGGKQNVLAHSPTRVVIQLQGFSFFSVRVLGQPVPVAMKVLKPSKARRESNTTHSIKR